MKAIRLFYAEYIGKYVINEKGEKNLDNVPSENIKDSIENALKILVDKYKKRSIILEADINEKDMEAVRKYIQDTKIEIG